MSNYSYWYFHTFDNFISSLSPNLNDASLSCKQSWCIQSQGLLCYQFLQLRYGKPLPYNIAALSYFSFEEPWHIIWTISNHMKYGFANVTLQNFSFFSIYGFFAFEAFFSYYLYIYLYMNLLPDPCL